MNRILLVLAFVFCSNFIFSQTCDLGLEDFTGSSSANPPQDWMISSGVFIGQSFPIDAMQDPATSLNLVGENVISESYECLSEICFDWHSSNVNSVHQVEISYAQGEVDGNTVWNSLDIIATPGSGNTPNSYQNVCYTIPTNDLIAPFDVRIKWNMIQRTNGTFYIENVCAESGFCNVDATEFSFKSLQSGCKEIDAPISVTVCATDAGGTVDQTYTDNITLAKITGSGNISGTLSGTASNGCFSTMLVFDNEDVFTLSASSSANSFIGVSQNINIIQECPNDDTLRVMSYNLLNFPEGRDDCGASNTIVPNRWDSLANINTYLNPDILLVCELQNSAGADSILSRSLNINGETKYMAANFIPNQSSSNTDLNNMFYYNAEKVILYSQEEIQTANRDFNKYTVYANDSELAVNLDTIFIDFYMVHLKAGNTASDRLKRATACQILRDYLDARPSRNNVIAGDLNLYTDTEDAYQILTSGIYPFHDPADQEGNWNNNQAYADVLTQSTRATDDPPYDCGATGGIDSRFDFVMTSETIKDSLENVNVIAGSYNTVGNNGSTYNQAINTPSNTSGVPPSVLNSLYYMSDHIPVTLDLKVTYPEMPIDSCIYVYTNADSGDGSLRSAIGCSVDGSVITFSPNLNNMTITITSDSMQIDKDINIRAKTTANITVTSVIPQSPSIVSLFKINAGKSVKMEGFQIDGAFGPDGSAICNEGDLTLDDMIITNGGRIGLNSVIQNKPGAILKMRGDSRVE
ncbi:MAG: exonuclease III [Saprospiraceae bacterium]|jgi:exonuclease III